MQQSVIRIGANAVSLFLAACSESESTSVASEDTAPANERVAAQSAPATPQADDISTVDGTALADFTGDAAAGERAFMQCRTCHVMDPGVNRMGPSLAGIIGRKAGSVDGFNYSPAMAESEITWTPEKLYQFLENPRRVVPGNRMAFAGVRNDQERANLIAYLKDAQR